MSNARRVPDWLLERYAQGELDPQERHALAGRLAREPELARRLDALRSEDFEVLSRYPPESVLGEVRRREGRPKPSARLPGRPILALGAACAAATLLIVFLQSHPQDSDRLKGDGARLLMYRVRDGVAEQLADGAMVEAGDTVQPHYLAAGEPFGMVLSLDGRGHCTLHLPDREDRAAELSSQGPVALPHSYRLDDAPSFERFFFVTGKSAFAVRPVVEACRALLASPDPVHADLALPADVRASSFLVRKPPP